ncbi:MAG: TetR family transcriptional regulator [Gluconacetobacter diazotrophicus]|nr:TetR family transcriptional regulator [Gluconacetobacter diazotrophicus]
MSGDDQEPAAVGGRRERVRGRIAAAGVRLFLDRGYEATTLDAIAEAAGVSRRTFFNYFASKDDVLLARPGQGFADAVGPALRSRSAAERPLDAARDTLIELVGRFETVDALAIQRLLVSTPRLRAHKREVHARIEADVLAAMREVWSGDVADGVLVVTAMTAVGTLRAAQDRWRDDEARRPLAEHLGDTFRDLATATAAPRDPPRSGRAP